MAEQYLSESDFSRVVASTPLISIDLIVEGKEGLLLGLRRNRPAQGSWFVPGGRIRKGESLESAFARLCADELGIKFPIHQAEFLGVFQHFYEDSALSKNESTHYVVIAMRLNVSIDIESLPSSQHADYRYFSKELALLDERVHKHTKWYINKEGFHVA